MAAPRVLKDGLSPIVPDFDLYLLDVWGTVYDGQAAFPGVAELLRSLRRQGKHVVLLSNSPQLPAIVEQRMQRIGIGRDCYDAIVTSGGEGHDALVGGGDPDFRPFAGRVFETGPERFPHSLPADRFETVRRIDEADWILNAGPRGPGDAIDDYEDLLSQAVRRNLPMLCTNPDRVVDHGGVRQICAGALAERYRELGGDVHAVGKPHPAVFRRSCALFGDVAADRVIMIGDNLETDILGANRAGLAGALIASGVHDLVDEGGAVDLAGLARAEQVCGARADYVLPRLAW